jgi:hypothetical protein
MRIATLLIGLLVVGPAHSAPLILKCTDSSGQPVADLQVDLAGREMRWSILRYRITQLSDRYISALQLTAPSDVGGEVWVLDRVTGRYTRASVAVLATGFSGNQPVNPRLEASTYTGTCKEPVL